MTLTGRVLPIGGVKEKTIAARRSGVKTLIFPKANQHDFEELSGVSITPSHPCLLGPTTLQAPVDSPITSSRCMGASCSLPLLLRQFKTKHSSA